MPDEFDAFGRKKEDSGLGDLGWGITEPPKQAPKAVQTVSPVTRAGRPRGRGLGVAWLVSLIVLGGVGLAVYSVGKGAKDTFDSARDLIPSGPVVEEADDTVPTQVRAASLFTPKALRAGVRILAREQPGRISNFRLAKDRIDVQVIRGGRTHIVQLLAGAEAPAELTSTTAIRPAETLSYEELNPSAPARLLRAANARLNTSPRQANYLIARKASGPLEWGVYYTNGKIAFGDSRGRFTRRVS